MRSNKQIHILSEDEEFCKSFKRALNAVGSMTVVQFTGESIKNKNRAILISLSEDKMPELFYEKIRGAKHLNPVAIIGFKEKKSFEKEFPIFHDHPYNHAYVKIPFNLLEFIDLLKNMIPISSQAMRGAICGSDTGYKGYLLKLLSHDLLKDRERCAVILNMAGNYLNESDISQEIKNAIEKINKEDNWATIASEIGKKLENRIKGGNGNDKN